MARNMIRIIVGGAVIMTASLLMSQQLVDRTVEGRAVKVRAGDFDIGYAHGRAWVDIDSDGEADYCRVGGDKPNRQIVECTLFRSGTQTVTFENLTEDWGYDAGRQWVDADGDKRIDYCRIRGNPPQPFYECMLGSGDGKFGQSLRAPAMDSQIPDFLKKVETTCWEETMCRSGTEVVRRVCKSTDGRVTEGPWRRRGTC